MMVQFSTWMNAWVMLWYRNSVKSILDWDLWQCAESFSNSRHKWLYIEQTFPYKVFLDAVFHIKRVLADSDDAHDLTIWTGSSWSWEHFFCSRFCFRLFEGLRDAIITTSVPNKHMFCFAFLVYLKVNCPFFLIIKHFETTVGQKNNTRSQHDSGSIIMVDDMEKKWWSNKLCCWRKQSKITQFTLKGFDSERQTKGAETKTTIRNTK